jgi:hypothetical protein
MAEPYKDELQSWFGGALYNVCGQFNVTPPTPMDGQFLPLQQDSAGNLLITIAAGGSGTIGTVNQGSPNASQANGWWVRITDGTHGPVNVLPLTNADAAAVAIVDANGNQITSFGGGTQYATGTAVATPTGTAALGWDGANVRVLSTDVSGQLKVLVQNTPTVTVSGNVNVTQGTSPWVISFTAPQHVIVDSGTVSITGAVGVTQSTSPWIVAGAKTPTDSYANPTDAEDVFALLGGWDATNTKWQRVQVDAGTGTLKVDIGSNGTVAVSGNVNVTQGTSPWVISFTAPQHVIVDSGTISVTQGTSPWVVSLASTTITGNVNVVGTTTDGTTTETNFLVVGGESNDATAQYQPVPLGTTGRSVIIEGVVGGTAVPVSGSISFSSPQHVIVDSGTVSVTQGTSPWIVAGAKTPSDTFANPTDAEDAFALLGGWDATNSVWRRVQVDAGTGVLKVDIGSNGTVAIVGNVNVTQGTSPWVVSGTVATNADTTIDGTIAPSKGFLVLGQSDDVTPIYAPLPLAVGGESLVVSGTVAVGSGGGTSAVDESTFTLGITSETPIGGVFLGGSNVPTVGLSQTGALQITADRKLVISDPQDNQILDLLQTLILETRAMRSALVYMVTENGDVRDSDFDPASQDFQPVN